MSRLIDADAFVEAIKGVEVSWYLDGNYTTYDETTIMDIIKQQPTVEAVPKSYAEQICWERDVAVGQLNEIGCQFGQKMDEVKKKLEVLQWIPCSERLPEENRDGWTELVLSIKTGEVILGFWHDIETGFCRRFRDGVCSAGGVIAWMPLPPAFKGE